MKYCYEEGQKRTGHMFMGEEITRSARCERHFWRQCHRYQQIER